MQPIGNTGERFCSLCLKDSGVLYEDPYIQIGVEAEWRAHHGHLVLFLGNKNTSPLISVQSLVLPPAHLKMELSLVPETIPPRSQVNAKLHLLAVLNKFLEPIPVSAEEFSPQWKITFLTTFKASRSGMYLLQVRGVRPLPLLELANLFNSYHLTSCPGLIRIETDPADNRAANDSCFGICIYLCKNLQ
ncbi:hypothetical protein JHK85_033878 [Glycine max]|nr:hypothetical protein JHK85_033878 [Glycine max]